MHKFASFNHKILHTSEPKINAISSASLYGKGIFTTIAIYNSKPFLWEKHWRRLNNNAEVIGLDLSGFNEQKVHKSLSKIIEKNKIKNARCRLTFFDESSSKIWQSENKAETSFLIQTAEERKTKKELSVYISPYPIYSRSPIAGIKSCNYLENILAVQEAKEYKFDEAIRYNERNNVVSFCMANIFWLEYNNSQLFTPSLKTGCLAGTTRELILENYKVLEVEKEINSLFRDAETIFMTSSGLGIVQVADFDGSKLNTDPHEITELIQSELEKSEF